MSINQLKQYRNLVLLWLILQPLFSFSQSDEELFQAFTYRDVGPTRGGRATTVTGINDQPGTFYMGSSGGGLWKTSDYGITWKNVSDGYFATGSIGAVRVVQSNPDIVYVGTGSDGIRSNVITGKGVYKSTDAGKSWEHIGLRDVGQIGAVEIHPNDENTVFVAAIGQAFQASEDRGVYKTTDGGKSWGKVLYHSDTVGAVDLEFSPDDPNTLYASLWRAERKPWTIISGGHQAGGIYKSTDGGQSWTKKTSGLPEGLIGKIDLAVSAADPQRLYAIVEAPEKQGGLYRSDDRGESFVQVSDRKELVNRPFYYCNVDSNPKNADVVISNANPAMISRDAGKTWRKIIPPHGDNHDIWINPNDTLTWIQCNDGGANVTTNGGETWSSQHNQPTAELYQVEVDDQYPYWLYAGQQDNTTISVPSLPPYVLPGGGTAYWMAVGGCETGPAVPKPGNANIVYSDCKGRFGVYDKRTGQEKQYYVGATNMYGHNPKDLKFRFQRVSPIHVSKHNPDIVYHTSQYVHRTTDDGVTWEIISPDLTAFEPDKQVVPGTPITRDVTGEEYYSTIYSIRESPLKEGLLWVGANDGPVHVTRDGGKNWDKVTPDMPDGGRVDCVEPSPHNEGKAYIAVLRYQLGDWKPYIYKTTDYGQNWSLLTPGNNGIPADYPTRVVREDPVKEGVLYAGTEFGLFVSLDDGQSWKPFQQDLPVTPVTDLKVHRDDLVISTMGRGFWIMDNVTSLHQMDKVSSSDHYLFKPKNTVRYRYRYRTRFKEKVPQYPDPFINIDYFLADKPSGELALEIINAEGTVVNSFTSSGKDENKEEEVDMGTGFSDQGGKPALSVSKGTNRFNWDLRHLGAWSSNVSRSYLNGPMVSPGAYTARLRVDGKEYKQSFELLINPNLEEAGVGIDEIKEQEGLALRVTSLLEEARRLEDKIKSRIKEAKGKALNSLKAISAELTTAEGVYMTPMLTDQARYLLNMLNQADQKPGKDAYERLEELSAKLKTLKEKYKALK